MAISRIEVWEKAEVPSGVLYLENPEENGGGRNQ